MKLRDLMRKETRVEIIQVLDGGMPNTQMVIALDWNKLLETKR
jgi:hypothetical protein